MPQIQMRAIMEGSSFSEIMTAAVLAGAGAVLVKVAEEAFHRFTTDKCSIRIELEGEPVAHARLVVLGWRSFLANESGWVEFRIRKGTELELAVFDDEFPFLILNSLKKQYCFVKRVASQADPLVLKVRKANIRRG
ncbi:MAG: hypothetical protein GC165_09725 [Armatimonadetes bacterium]|nr:hypothetical protein [Armatimonadota bacterium]MBS1728589.1 hypothetical protein [Armatimonadota bacterium]